MKSLSRWTRHGPPIQWQQWPWKRICRSKKMIRSTMPKLPSRILSLQLRSSTLNSWKVLERVRIRMPSNLWFRYRKSLRCLHCLTLSSMPILISYSRTRSRRKQSQSLSQESRCRWLTWSTLGRTRRRQLKMSQGTLKYHRHSWKKPWNQWLRSNLSLVSHRSRIKVSGLT